MDRRHLEYFLAVVDHHGFTAASRALHIAQPSLSQTIKRLERELGTQLFDRLGHTVRLTSAGEALVGPARRVVREFGAARGAVTNVETLESGRLDIVALPSLAVDPTSHLVSQFHARYPGVRIRLTTPGSADILQVVRSGDSELGVTVQPVQRGSLTITEFQDEQFLVGLPPRSGVAQGSTLAPKELERFGLIATITTQPMLARLLMDAGVDPTFVVETAHREAIVPMVLGGVGAALFTPTTARDARLRGAVICQLNPPITRRVVIAYRMEGLSPAATAFLNLCGGPGAVKATYSVERAGADA